MGALVVNEKDVVSFRLVASHECFLGRLSILVPVDSHTQIRDKIGPLFKDGYFTASRAMECVISLRCDSNSLIDVMCIAR